jgi:hypothetical protein
VGIGLLRESGGGWLRPFELMTSPDPVPKPADGTAPDSIKELVPLRRSFPVPRRRRNYPSRQARRGVGWKRWISWGLLVAAVTFTGIAAWNGLHPVDQDSSKPVMVMVPPPAFSPDPFRPDSPDPAQSIYFSSPPAESGPAAPASLPATHAAPASSTPAAGTSGPTLPGDLEKRYLGALERASAGAQGKEAAAWAAEIERVKSGAPLPPPAGSQPAELQRLLSIYRREFDRMAWGSTPVPPGTRRVEVYFAGDDTATLFLNGDPARSEYLSGSEKEPGSIQRAMVVLKPGDVLGVQCTNEDGPRGFCLVARAGSERLLASSDHWEASPAPDDAWWKGEGKTGARPEVVGGQVDSNAARFEKVANVRSGDYSVLWVGSGEIAAFRYRVQAADVAER